VPTADPIPLTALAPMQDVTTLPFMRIIAGYGSPSFYVTEYFRVHEHSTLEPHILASITQNESGRPVYAQLIGEDLHHLERTVDLLAPYPIAGIDLNMGCPAPKVYKKNVGGGLLREPARVDAILGCLRAAITGSFTVKMRVGFADWAVFPEILDLVNHHRVDLLTVHGRTVKEMYRGEPHYDLIEQAVAKAPMRESMAALFLRACGYLPGEAVLDPMCGSGTFPIEAAEVSLGLAPGRDRGFAFERLAGADLDRWAEMRSAARAEIREGRVLGFGLDRDAGAVAMAGENAARAGIGGRVAFAERAVG